VVYFKHNNMDSLRETLENITSKYKGTKNLRRYIVIEALYLVDLVFHACCLIYFTHLYRASNGVRTTFRFKSEELY